MIFKFSARMARLFLIVVCSGWLAAAAQQAPTDPATQPTTQPSTSALSLTEPHSAEDQMQVQEKAQPTVQEKLQNENSAKPQLETRSHPQPKPAKKQRQRDARNANSNFRQHASRSGAAAPGAPKKIVVRHGGTEEPTAQIVTGMNADEADRERREAELLLSTTDEKLKEIAPRPVDSQQEETVLQIYSYMARSRTALKQGDVSRAHTLALKAGLLTEDLASH